MQKAIVITMITLLVSSQALAGFRINRRVYRMDQLKSAQAKAKSKGMPITFLYTDENTTCGLCAGASVNMIDTLRTKSIIVYADVNSDWQQLPNIVQKALKKPEAGKYIPKAVLVDSEITKVIAIVPYARGKEQNTLLRQARKEIAKAMPKTAPSRKPLTSLRKPVTTPIQSDENREVRTWKSTSGAEVRASLVKESGSYLVLKKEDGSRVQILTIRLSTADQQYVQELKERIKTSVQQSSTPYRSQSRYARL